MFSSSAYRLPSITSYAAAHKHFTKTNQPRGKAWEPHQRPLDDARKHHYRIEKVSGEDAYDICLHQTCMARYWAPSLLDGRYLVEYTAHSSNTSKAFMASVTHTQKVLNLATQDGRRVCVPLTCAERGTSLLFDVNGALITESSTHAPIVHHKMHPDFKAWRKDARAQLGNIVPLLEMSVHDVCASSAGGRPTAYPFTAYSSAALYNLLRARFNWAKPYGDAWQPVIDALQAYWHATATLMADEREITPKDVTQYCVNKLLADRPAWIPPLAYVPLPQFPEVMPPKGKWSFR